MNATWAVALAALIAQPPAYVVPGDRLLTVLEERRSKLGAIRVRAELSGVVPDWPQEVVFELHPAFGYRVSDDQGGRWLIRAGRVLAGSSEPPPAWIPELELLVLKLQDELLDWCVRANIDIGVNELARCGDQDCFVLGGRSASAQLWIDKERLEILRWVAPLGRAIEYSSYADWDGRRFPTVVELRDGDRTYASLAVHTVSAAPGLGPRDFAPSWVIESP